MLASMRPLVTRVLPAGLRKEMLLSPASNALFSTSTLMTVFIATIVYRGATSVTAPLVLNAQRVPTALEVYKIAPHVLEANSRTWEPLVKMNVCHLRVTS